MSIWALLGNILWLVIGPGFAFFLLWVAAGAIMFLTVIGIPFSFAAFRIARFSVFPFGQRLVDAATVGERRVTGTALANILWFVLAGAWLGLLHLLIGVLYSITIIGLPFGLAHFRLASISLMPLGKRVVPA